jgi:hypothetical protein
MSLEGLSGLVNRIIAWADRLQRKHGVLGFPYAVVKKYGDDDGGRQAALITYYGFLSIFPLLLIGVAVLSRVLADHPDLRQRLIKEIVPQALRSTVEHSLATLPSSTIPFVAGLIGLLLSATGVVFSAYQTLNHVAAVRYRLRAGFLSRYVRVFVVLATLLAGALATGALTVVATALTGQPGLQRVAAWLGSALVVFAVLLLGAKLLLARPAPVRALWPGAIKGGGGDGRAQRRGAVAGQAGGQGRTRLRQLRHRGRHVRPAVPGRSGAGVCGRSRSRPLCPAVATRPGRESPHRGRCPRAGPAGPRAGTHPRRPHPVPPRSGWLPAGTGWFPAGQCWSRVARPPQPRAGQRHRRSGGRALGTAQPVQGPARSGASSRQASDRCPYRLAGAQNSQICIARVLISIVPTSGQNGGSRAPHPGPAVTVRDVSRGTAMCRLEPPR